MRPLTLALLTIALGLASRKLPLPAGVGDALYAVMAFWLFRVALDAHRALAAALAFCFAIELSQLYHSPWIDALRATRLGGLVLGYAFLWSDLACYAVGAGVAYAIERTAFRSAAGTG